MMVKNFENFKKNKVNFFFIVLISLGKTLFKITAVELFEYLTH